MYTYYICMYMCMCVLHCDNNIFKARDSNGSISLRRRWHIVSMGNSFLHRHIPVGWVKCIKINGWGLGLWVKALWDRLELDTLVSLVSSLSNGNSTNSLFCQICDGEGWSGDGGSRGCGREQRNYQQGGWSRVAVTFDLVSWLFYFL